MNMSSIRDLMHPAALQIEAAVAELGVRLDATIYQEGRELILEAKFPGMEPLWYLVLQESEAVDGQERFFEVLRSRFNVIHSRLLWMAEGMCPYYYIDGAGI